MARRRIVFLEDGTHLVRIDLRRKFGEPDKIAEQQGEPPGLRFRCRLRAPPD